MGILAMLLDDDEDDAEDPKPQPQAITESSVPVSNGLSTEAINGQQQSESSKYPKLDESKMVKMAIIHDIAECIVGDITPFDNITEEDKHRRELDAMKHLGIWILDFNYSSSDFISLVIV